MEGLLQPIHLVFIMLLLLIFFGGKKLPELGRGLGAGIKEFKDALKTGMNDQPPPVDKKPEEEKKS
ncbi:MAG: twin-arginine translocase TatA/TatE family subunit [Acidobacteria bacterium]|nr:MAG: twin-arginine translocase TatA/TatE family subunit [Acidobacteriota bacterium]